MKNIFHHEPMCFRYIKIVCGSQRQIGTVRTGWRLMEITICPERSKGCKLGKRATGFTFGGLPRGSDGFLMTTRYGPRPLRGKVPTQVQPLPSSVPSTITNMEALAVTVGKRSNRLLSQELTVLQVTHSL